MKSAEDIPWAQRASDAARERGIRLAHQCHTASLLETVEGSLEVLRAVGRPNFGLIYEPANLELCGQPYGPEVIERFAPHLFNVYLQNQLLTPDGRAGSPQDVANAYLFLASEEAGFINGAVLSVDGGLVLGT